MIATAFAVLALSAPMTAPPCRPSQYGAKVGAVSLVRGMSRGRLPSRTGRTPSPTAVAEGDILCGGEVVTNPVRSGLRVVISLPGGREIVLGAGEQASIPMPGLVTRLAALVGQFDRLFSPDEHVPGLTRGIGGNGSEASERITRVVPAWGPLVIAWPSTASKGAWGVSVDQGGRTFTAQVSRPFARIDVSTYCRMGCLVTVAKDDGRIMARRRIVPASPSEVQAPRWLNDIDGGMEERALLGAWLAGRLGDPAWVEQGLALMWPAACPYPAVHQRLSRQIEGIEMGDACNVRALSLRPKP